MTVTACTGGLPGGKSGGEREEYHIVRFAQPFGHSVHSPADWRGQINQYWANAVGASMSCVNGRSLHRVTIERHCGVARRWGTLIGRSCKMDLDATLTWKGSISPSHHHPLRLRCLGNLCKRICEELCPVTLLLGSGRWNCKNDWF